MQDGKLWRRFSLGLPIMISLLLAACAAPSGEGAGRDTESAPPSHPEVSEQATKAPREGIDVSHFQGAVDWSAVRAAGKSFAFAKATEGKETVDGQFEANWAGMKAAGLVRGAYHFFDAEVDAMAQAEHFLATVQLEPGDLAPALDVELSDGVDAAQLKKDLATFIGEVEQALGIRPILYSNKNFAEAEKLGQAFGSYPLWLAHYGDDPPEPPAGWETYVFWQYSQSGQVPGVSGDVDLDRYSGAEGVFQSLRLPGPQEDGS